MSFIKKNKTSLLFIAISFLLYSNSLKNEYGLDDELVTGNKNITAKGFKAIPKIFKSHHVTDESGNTYEYRPIVKVAFAVEHQFFGVKPAVSHFFNILLYGVCLILLFKLLKLIFPLSNDFTIATCVVIFSFLPVHSEVVVSLKNRDVLLSFIFTMLSTIYFIKFTDQKKLIYFVIGVLSLITAFLSKYDVLPYSLIILLLIYQRKKLNIKYIVTAVLLGITLYFVLKLIKRNLVDKAVTKRVFVYFENPLFFEKTFQLRASTLLNSMGFYLKMLVFPNNMSCFYGYNAIPIFSFVSLYALAGLLSIPVMVWGFFKWFKTPNWYWYSILFFGISISMYLNYPKPAPGIVADRFLFFASVGFAIFVTQILFFDNKLKRFPSKILEFSPRQKVISFAIVIICSGVTITRNTEWKNKLVLFESDVKKYPESVKLSQLYCSEVFIEINKQNGLIKENEKYKKLADCETYLKNAIKTDSSCSSCYNNLSYLLLNFKNDPKDALIYLKAAERNGEERKELYCNLGIAYYRLNRFDSATLYLRKAIDRDEDGTFMAPFGALADVYSKSDIKGGIAFFTKMVQEKPGSEQFNLALANLCMMDKDTLQGVKYYRKVVEINPNNSRVSQYLKGLENLLKRQVFDQ